MNCQLCSKLYNRVNKFAAYNIGYIRVVFCYEKNLAYICPVWHILKHNLAYFVFVDLATLRYSSTWFRLCDAVVNKLISESCHEHFLEIRQ